jgi:hypothetical protein
MSGSLKKSIVDYTIVLAVGVSIFLFFYFQSLPRLSWSDEIVYAVMGRNIATGRGVVTNFYYPKAITEGGYPLGDSHMPGYSLILGLSFWIWGETESAAFFPNYVSYLICGLLLFWLGKNLFDRWAGFGSALTFYAYPGMIGHANTAMAELTLVLLSVIFLLIWYKSISVPKLRYGVLMAVMMIAGLLHRETFLAFLLPALYALWLWPKPERLWAGIYFGITFVVLFCVFFIPFYLARSPYLTFMSVLMTSSDPLSLLLKVIQNNLKTFQELTTLAGFRGPFWLQLQFFLSFLIFISYFTFTEPQKRICLYAFYILLANILAMFIIYPLNDRILLYLLPPVLVLTGGVLSRLKLIWLKTGVLVLLICFLLYASLFINDFITKGRQRELDKEIIKSDIISKFSDSFHPRAILVDSIFLYGWTHYPVTVVWFRWEDQLELEKAGKLWGQVPIDVIAVRNPLHRDQIYAANQEGLLPIKYDFVGQEQGYYVFVNRQ